MRCVTMNPPTTLMDAKTTAKNPKMDDMPPTDEPATSTAPTIVMPLIALEPDINGVCSVGGTFVISSNPIKIANTKTVRLAIGSR